MVETTLTVKNQVGLHARPASQITRLAKKCNSTIIISKGDTEANARSMLHLLALEASCGDEVRVVVSGTDEEDVLATVCEIISSEEE